MSQPLPKDLSSGIEAHIRRIEQVLLAITPLYWLQWLNLICCPAQVVGDTSASQSETLRQLSTLEQGSKHLSLKPSLWQTRSLTDLLLHAALHSVKRALPSDEFVSQLDKVNALQHRLQKLFSRLRLIEASDSH